MQYCKCKVVKLLLPFRALFTSSYSYFSFVLIPYLSKITFLFLSNKFHRKISIAIYTCPFSKILYALFSKLVDSIPIPSYISIVYLLEILMIASLSYNNSFEYKT